MALTQKLRRISALKISFSKSTEFSETFAKECNAFSMYDIGFGLNIPSNLSSGNQLRAVFREVALENSIFSFNISGVDLKKAKKGFDRYEEAEYNNQITEWELFMILQNKDYLKSCIFHNGKVQFKKQILWNSIM